MAALSTSSARSNASSLGWAGLIAERFRRLDRMGVGTAAGCRRREAGGSMSLPGAWRVTEGPFGLSLGGRSPVDDLMSD
jgi:hypothetical protein